MKVYKITEEAYTECGKVLTLISELEEYFPRVDQLISNTKDPEEHNSISIMIDFIENHGDNALYPRHYPQYKISGPSNWPIKRATPGDIPILTPEYLLETYKQETLDMLVAEDYLEVDDNIQSYMEQVEFNIKEGKQDIFTALVDFILHAPTSYGKVKEELENYGKVKEELENTPNGLSIKQVGEILWVLENRSKIISLLRLPQDYFKLPENKAIKPLNLNHNR